MAKRLTAKHLASTTQIRRGAVLAVAVAAATSLAVYTGTTGAGAAAAPTIGQVKAQINTLQAKMDKIGQQYDAANQEYGSAQARLAQVQKQAASAQARYNAARAQLAQVAVSEYENSSQTSILGLLSSGNPANVLSQASLVLEVAGTHNEEATQYLTAAQTLASVTEQRQRTEQGIAQIRAQLAAQKTSLNKLLATSQATLDSLTTAQQAQVTADTIGGGGTSSGGQPGSTPMTYTGPTGTQADKAVAFAYAQLGKPYVYGATGPRLLRLLRPGPGRLGGGGRRHPQDHLRGLGRPAAHPRLRDGAGRPDHLRRRRPRRHIRRRRLHHRRPAYRRLRRAGPVRRVLVRR